MIVSASRMMMMPVVMTATFPVNMLMRVVMAAAFPVNMLIRVVMTAAFPVYMLMMMMIVTASLVMMMRTVIFAMICLVTALFHVAIGRVAAVGAPTARHPLLLSQHFIYYCLLRFFHGHFVTSNKFHSLFSHKPVHLFALFFHELLDINILITEPTEVIRDQMQVVAALTPDKDDSHLVGIF